MPGHSLTFSEGPAELEISLPTTSAFLVKGKYLEMSFYYRLGIFVVINVFRIFVKLN